MEKQSNENIRHMTARLDGGNITASGTDLDITIPDSTRHDNDQNFDFTLSGKQNENMFAEDNS